MPPPNWANSATERDLQRLVEVFARRRSDADVAADGDPHAAESRRQGAHRAHHEGDGHANGQLGIAFTEGVPQVNDDRQSHGQTDDGRVLAA
jgi:hypothetical protein